MDPVALGKLGKAVIQRLAEGKQELYDAVLGAVPEERQELNLKQLG
jgi:hypothetical protein